MKRNDADDQPTPIVKLPQAHKYAQLLSDYVVEHSSQYSTVIVMNLQSFMNLLNKMSISNISKHYEMPIDSYLCSV